MGHVSDFNGMNTCDEADLPQTSDLISTDSLLDLPLNENFMPIYHSFPDDIYRQPQLYASNNLSSFMNNEDDRSGYFDEPLELDLFFDPNFNIDFDPTEAILENASHATQNNTESTKIETNNNERNVSTDFTECTSNLVDLQDDSENQCEKNTVNPVFSSTSCNDDNIHSDAAVNKDSELTGVKNEQIPKIIIKLKPESQNIDQNFTCIENSTVVNNTKSDLTNSDNTYLKTRKVKVKDKHKHKKHKKKSRHKKNHDLDKIKNKIPGTNKSVNDNVTNCAAESYVNLTFNNKNTNVNTHLNDSKTLVYNQNSGDNSNDDLSFVNTNFQSHENNYVFHDIIKTETFDAETDEQVAESLIESDSLEIKSEPLCDELPQDELSNSLSVADAVDIKTDSVSDEMPQNELNESLSPGDAIDFQFKFENTDELSPSSPICIQKENDSSLDNFCHEIDDSSSENIPFKSVLKTEKDESSSEGLEHEEEYEKQEINSNNENNNTVLNNEPNKSSSASDLIEELNAHHQQVFEEIEVSTSELKSELNDAKNTDIRPKTSHHSHNSANDHIILQNIKVLKHGENDMNSQNHISDTKISSATHISAFQSTSNHHSSTARLKSISSSSSSINSKSSTSHRSYRKRRRSSSSSSSSDQERFYNRPVKYDPVTQTYCDEFGREIRPSELKYYLNSKSSLRDSHSNNGSSSSSRSKSPRYKTHHRKYHKSRSGSRSHRRSHRRHSSSRSRSRSRSQGRRHKDTYDSKYRSLSPKHRIKRHYLDIEENMRAYEERRVMYVGDIPPDYTVEQLKERFSRFGPIQSASIKSKFTADGSLYIFGFVTFKNRSDVCQAIERGNENPSWPRFDLNFGGRRRFCNGNYTDLDGKVAEAESGWYQASYRQQPRQEDDFAELLRQEQRRLGMSKK